MALSSTRAGVMRLVVQELTTGSESLLDTGTLQIANPAISPSGATIAFEGRDASGNSDIYLIPIGGGTPTAIGPSARDDAGPSWSPHDAVVFFVSNRTSYYEIWSVKPDGTDLRQVTTNSNILGKPDVAPDGQSLAYARWAPGGTEVVIRTLSDDAERVIGLPDDTEPAFDSTGTNLAVRTSRFGGNDVVILDVTTGALLSRVTDGTYRAGLPAFPR